jgi:Cu2+-exporting ATPase
VTDLLPADGIKAEKLLHLAASLEAKSEHPLARAIMEQAQEQGIFPDATTDFSALPGNGLTAALDGVTLLGGSRAYLEKQVALPKFVNEQAKQLAKQGKTPLLFARDGVYIGTIAVADTIKEDSRAAVEALQQMGIRVVMLTGDNEQTARAIGTQAGVDEVIAGVLPDGKESVIRKLKEQGKVAMVGDGINDAPALTAADTGIAIGAGTDVAIDAASVVLMKSRLSDVPNAIRLSRATLRNIHQNLFWAFFYNVIGIPLAAGVWYPIFGIKLNPMFGAAAMSLSSFCVVTNALRLNLFRMQEPQTAEQPAANTIINQKEREDSTMKKMMKIEGMMCGHCEAHVKKALEEIPQVQEALVSHEAGTAEVTLSEEVADEVLQKAVEAQNYKVVSIQ